MKKIVLIVIGCLSFVSFAQQTVNCASATTAVNFVFTNVNSGLFVAQTTIQASNQVSNVSYFAGQSVSLTNGFKGTATSSTNVKAAIGVCQPGSIPTSTLQNDNLSNLETSFDIQAYPVPADTQVTVSWLNHEFKSIKLLDLHGKVLYDVKLSSTDLSHVIPLYSFANGIYVIHLEDANGFLTSKKISLKK